MRVLPIIDRLKAEALTLGGRVIGAAEFESNMLGEKRLDLPWAAVMRAGGVASESAAVGGVVQQYTEEFAIIVVINNSDDPAGFAASEAFDDVFEDVVAAILGWTPPKQFGADSEQNAFILGRDDHVGMDRGRLLHQMIISTNATFQSKTLGFWP